MQFEDAKKAKSKAYRTYMYKRVEDGSVDSVIVGVTEAEALYDKGWRMSPVDLAAPELQEDPHFAAAADGLAGDLNRLLNLKSIKDKDILESMAKALFDVDLDKRWSVKRIQKKIHELANKKGMEVEAV